MEGAGGRRVNRAKFRGKEDKGGNDGGMERGVEGEGDPGELIILRERRH